MFDHGLDLRETPEPELLPRLLGELDRLRGGDRLVLVTAQWPGELLGAVERERPGRFVCGPLSEEAGDTRVEFGRRGTSERAVSEFVGWDQRRLDDMLDEVDELASGDHFIDAQRRYRDFRFGLRHHHRMEEAFLFPLFVRLHGEPGPIPSMHAEHVLISACADEVGDALNAHDLSAFASAIEQLHEVLDAHDRREESEVYPLIDEVLSRRDREALVSYLQTT